MRTIPLSRGYEAIVDDEDYERLSQYRWHAFVRVFGDREYVLARRSAGNRTPLMHREILNAPDGVEVDHRNGNGLDNRRKNLRLCTRSQNMANTPNKTRGLYRGVRKNTNGYRWTAKIGISGRQIVLGSAFETPELAAAAYNAAALREFGEFAVLNKLPEDWHG